jgi:hypothetical protein
MANQLEEWVRDLCTALGLDPAVVDRDLVLDLARDTAHAVARPAAPLTAFLVGLAAGQRGGGAQAIAGAAATASELLATREPTNPQ